LTAPRIHVARFHELTPAILYDIMKLRQDVFVIEQDCVYDDLDGRDTEESARHLWIERHGAVVSALRLLRDSDGAHRIGRIVTRGDHRSQGLAALLVTHAMQISGRPLVLSAQSHLSPWYERFGFAVSGDSWVEANIEHVPMRLSNDDVNDAIDDGDDPPRRAPVEL